ncbi:hypothetical protein M9Y10_015308 [Tritrichomonas musculus]|uniref:Surface antigen BspA-like n=1 Tax=Tritrichomonas musculus TaxID=1915356 RepID=A0ABR2L220_9EUKA
MICDSPFFFCKIDELYIPSKFESFHENWCFANYKVKLIVSPDNKNFKYADGEHQILIGKSNINSENFDVVVLANRTIKNAKIPSTIKYISSYAFSNCFRYKLEHISTLFYFFIEIPEDSQIVSFGKESFSCCSIKKIFIPANFESFGYNCYSGADYLTDIKISPHNKNFKYADKDSKLIIGKSDPNSDNFDILIFANLSIEKAIIPSTIKIISPHAFSRCKNLRTIEFAKNSCLETIGDYSFSDTYIRKVVIPKSVKKIKHHAFIDCKKLKAISSRILKVW